MRSMTAPIKGFNRMATAVFVASRTPMFSMDMPSRCAYSGKEKLIIPKARRDRKPSATTTPRGPPLPFRFRTARLGARTYRRVAQIVRVTVVPTIRSPPRTNHGLSSGLAHSQFPFIRIAVADVATVTTATAAQAAQRARRRRRWSSGCVVDRRVMSRGPHDRWWQRSREPDRGIPCIRESS